MEKLSELSDVFTGQFSELRFSAPDKCLKIIGDAAFGFEFKRIRGQYKTYFVAYSLWNVVGRRVSDGCLFFWEIHDRRNLQVPFQLEKVERHLSRLLDGAANAIKPPLSGNIRFGEFSDWVTECQSDPFFRPFRWENLKLLRLALRTASYCREFEVARDYLNQIVQRSERDSESVSYDVAFNNEKNWITLLESEIELGLAGNPIVEANRDILRKRGLVVSDILNS